MDSANAFDMIGAVRRRLVLLLLLTTTGAVLGLGASLMMPPVYEGTASLLVGDFEDGNVSNNEILALQSLAATYADVARREPVLSRAAQDLGPKTDWHLLRTSALIHVPKESPQVIEVTVDGGSRRWVADAAGAIAGRIKGFVDQTSGGSDFVSRQLQRLEQVIERDQSHLDDLQAEQDAAGDSAPDSLARELARTQTRISASQDNYASFRELASTSSHVAIRRLGPAEAAATPVSPNLLFNTVMSAGTGFLLALALVYLLESRKRRADDEAAATTARLPILVPPNLLNGTFTVPSNGRSTLRVGGSGGATDHPEGDVR